MSIKKNFVYSALLTGSNLLFPLLTFPYLTRVLGAEGLGICNFILSYGQNFIIIAALGIPLYGSREIAKLGGDVIARSKLFFELLLNHILFTGFCLIIYTISIFLLDDFQDYKELALLGGFIILISVFRVEWLFTGVSDFKYITIRSLIIRSLSVLAIFILVKQKDDFTIFFLITTLTIFLTTVFNASYANKYITRRITLEYKKLFKHSKPVGFLGLYIILTNIYTILPVTLLGFLSTKAAVGYYFAADRIVRTVISIFTALSAVMIPRLNLVIEEKGMEEYLLLINKSFRVVFSLGIPITLYVLLTAEPLVNLLAGSEFSNSIHCVKLMAPVIFFVALAQILVVQILSVNRMDKEMVVLATIGMLMSITINVLFIRSLAEVASAYSQLVSEILVTCISYLIVRKHIKLHLPVKVLVSNVFLVLPVIPIVLISFRISSISIIQLMLSGVFTLIYFVFYQFVLLKDTFLLEQIKPLLKQFERFGIKI